MAALGGSAVPSLSQLHAWDTAHLEDAATHWSSRAWEWEDAFAEVHERVLFPPRAARQLQAQALAADIRAQAQNLAAVDGQVAIRISAAVGGLSTVRMVDNNTQKQDGGEPDPPPPTPPARGLPPEGLRQPVDGPLTPGPASRPSEQGKGGQSLWDERGGEWRYFPGDKWHNPHWDYNPHSNSPWDNIPINGLPPHIGGDAPPIISGLPPWLQNPPPAPAPAPDPGLMPHIDMPAPSPGDLQTAGGETAVVGGGALLLLILGALALA